jgi:hypothetical protein
VLGLRLELLAGRGVGSGAVVSGLVVDRVVVGRLVVD